MSNTLLQCNKAETVLLSGLFLIATVQLQIISGRMQSTTDNQPFLGVTIYVNATNQGTAIDEKGHYQLTCISPSNIQVSFFIGCSSRQIAVGSRAIVENRVTGIGI
jgi:hypothetical protein